MSSRVFRLVLIKPSRYDDDGYVIRWWRGGLPSNSLACLYGIAQDCHERQVLGADFTIDIAAIDAAAVLFEIVHKPGTTACRPSFLASETHC